jgi:hypothetical protein
MDCQTLRTEVHIEPLAPAVQAHLGVCRYCATYAERFARLDRVLRAELVVAAPAVVTDELALIAAKAAPSRLDRAVRAALVVEAPPALTVQLLDLAPRPTPVASPVDAALRDALLVQAPPALTMRLLDLVPQMAIAAQSAPVVAPQPLSRPQPRRWVVATVYFVTAALLLFSMLYAGQLYSAVITQLGLENALTQIAALPADLLERLYTVLPQSRIVIGVFVQLQQPLQWLLVALVLWAIVDMTQRQSRGGRRYA